MFNDAQAYLTACTVSGNSAGGGGGGLYEGSAGSDVATLGDTIVAGNAGIGGSAGDIGGPDAANVTGTYNLIGPGGSGGIGNGVGGNIVLAGLADLGLAPPGELRRADADHGPAPRQPRHRRRQQRPDPRRGPYRPARRAAGRRTAPSTSAPFESQGFTLTPVAGSTPQSATPGTAFANPLARLRLGQQSRRAGGRRRRDVQRQPGRRRLGQPLRRLGDHRRRRHGPGHRHRQCDRRLVQRHGDRRRCGPGQLHPDQPGPGRVFRAGRPVDRLSAPPPRRSPGPSPPARKCPRARTSR